MSNLSLTALLAAINSAQPTGIDLRQDTSAASHYYQIKDARNAAREVERRQLLGQLPLDEKARWDQVLKSAYSALTQHSKDIEVTTWLIEALIREQGLMGLQLGLETLTQLIEQYWEQLHPIMSAHDIALRVAAITSLNGEDYDGTLIQPIYNLPLTARSSSRVFTLWQYQQAIDNKKYTDRTQIDKRRLQGGIFVEEIIAAAQESGIEFYQKLQRELQQAQTAFDSLQLALAGKCGEFSPPCSQVIAALNVFDDHLRFLIKEAGLTIVPLSGETTMTTIASTAVTPSTDVVLTDTAMPSSIRTRQDALALLSKVATFFRQAEPQSPIPPLLDRAIRWGSMPFADLLKEIIKDEGVRKSAYELMGVDSN